jgi:Na+-driven multidrug efflux pump
VFTHDPAVAALITASLVIAALQQPLAAPVFVVDGVLIGAGDGRWLAGAGAIMLVAFLPAAAWVLGAGHDVVQLWWALTWFLVVRAALLAWRVRSPAWLRVSRTAGSTP